MKKISLITASLLTFVLTAVADEYTDPSTNVVYTYDPNGTTAEVKRGVRDDFDDSNTVYKAGSPNASGDVVILENIPINGKEFSVTKIGDYAFCMLNDLIHVSIPSSVRTIGREAFAGCSNLESVDMKEGLQQIGQESFRGCVSLKSVLLPSGLESIGFAAFSGCHELTSINIPASVQDIHFTSLYDCNSIGSITVEESNTIFDSRSNCNAIVKTADNMLLIGCKNTEIPNSVTAIGEKAFMSCQGLTEIVIPESVREIGKYAFQNCSNLKVLTLTEGLQTIRLGAFWECGLNAMTIPSSVKEIEPGALWMSGLATLTSLIEEPFEVNKICNLDACQTVLYVPAGAIEKYRTTPDWNLFAEIKEVSSPEYGPYHPFVEDGKVWVVKAISSWPEEEWIEYYYFDGDTIIDGLSAKRMLVDRVHFTELENTYREYVGAFYEKDKKVYGVLDYQRLFELLYDFTLSSGDSIQIDGNYMVPVYKRSGGITGFKGSYYDIVYSEYIVEHWLEGVGSEYYPWLNLRMMWGGKKGILLACFVGDEVIYYNSEEGDPYVMGARRRRFDFTHTTKIQPKARKNSDAVPLYGEYNEQQLGINLDPLDDTYQVRITDESGKAVYEKNINTGDIVGLNIDISDYAEGRYTVTVENSQETFTGEFEAQTTGIEVVRNKKEVVSDYIYNLSGQRLSTPPSKGIYIRNGKKIVF